MTINEKRHKRAALIAEARALLARADASGALGAEDKAQYDTVFRAAAELKETIDREEALEVEERAVATLQPTLAARSGQPGEPEHRTTERAGSGAGFEHRTGSNQQVIRAEARRQGAGQALGLWFRGGWQSLGPNEVRALQADSDTIGGYLRPDQEFVFRLIQAVDNMVFIRQWATVLPVTNADSLGIPSLETDASDPTWTSELLTGAADSAMAFGKRELRPHPLAKRILVSNKLLRQTAGPLDAEALVRERFAYKFAVTKEQAYLTGTGAGQPLGVFTASDDGIPTSRDVSTDNTTTSITADGLINVKYSLKPQYRMKATTRWMFHTDAIKQIAKLKDGDGQYIWKPGLVGTEPDRLLNIPYAESLYAPSTFTTGLYVGILGDWSMYWIAQALSFQIQRLVELKAETNQTEFIAREEEDGMPVLAEAFSRVKLA